MNWWRQQPEMARDAVGAVPIVLATYPLLLGLPGALLLFNVVFFVVLISALTQGWSLPWVARRLRLADPLGGVDDLAEVVAETVPGATIAYSPDCGPDRRSYRVSSRKIELAILAMDGFAPAPKARRFAWSGR